MAEQKTNPSVPKDFEYEVHHVPDDLLAPLRSSWDRLPQDPYLTGGYRFRRLTRFRVDAAGITPRPQRPVFQKSEHNHLFGDVPREFELIEEEVVAHPAFQALCEFYFEHLPMSREGLWLRAHQIRVVHDAAAGLVGRPDPEGPHREGERLVLGIMPVTMGNVVPGQTRLFREGESAACFETTLNAGDLLLVNDAKFLHTTEPFVRQTAPRAWRDIMLLTVTGEESDGTIL